MTRSAGPLALDEIIIPYGQDPNPPMPPDTWGINIAAVTGFTQGLFVQVPPWGDDMGIGDSVNVRLDANVVVSGFISNSNEIGLPVKLFIDSERLTTGTFYILDYTVTRLGTDPDPSPRTNIYVKLTLPGGRDENGSIPGHSELIMEIPEDILLEGVDADTQEVPITILSYPEIDEGDRIFLYWGSEKVEHIVTYEEANDPDNHEIVITVDKTVIDEAGDNDEDGIPVAFYVLDVVNNRSEDWSATIRINVDTGSSLLGAPLIKEAINNTLDIDDLDDPDIVTAQVIAVGSGFAVGDGIEMRLRGLTNDGEVVDKTYPLVPIDSINKVIDIPLPSIDVRLLVNTRAAFSFRLIKADGSADRLSKSQFVDVIGEATQLAAPIAEDAIAGTLDPALPYTLIEIPWDESMTEGQAIDLKWLGIRANTQIYFPTFDLYPISHGEEQDKEPLHISVDGEHLRAIEGGTLELFYLLLRDTEAREVVSRQSLHANILNIGEPMAELPPPVVEREQDGFLDPADVPAGTRLIVREYTGQIRGDVVHYVWNGSKTGIKTDYTPVTEINETEDIPFTINFDLIKNNEGGTVKASYWVTRAASGRNSPSEILPMNIGTAMDLSAPSVKQATGTAPTQQLNPVAAKDALTVVIPNYGILPGDLVSVIWTGTSGDGSYIVPAQELPGNREIPVPVEVIAYNLGRSVTVSYTVTRNGNESPPSELLNLAVQTIAQDDLLGAKPKILQAANQGDGTELDLNAISADATCWVGIWPLIAPDQDVWLRLKGTKADGTVPYDLNIWAPPPRGPRTNPTWIDQGFYEVPAAYSYLKELKDGSTLTMEFKADFSKTTNEANAQTFPLRTYTVNAIALIAPTLTDIRDSKGSVVDKITVETSVTVTGTGTSGQEIQLMDGATNIGSSFRVPDNSTTWSTVLNNLTAKTYSIKARPLYGNGLPDSAAKGFKITAVVNPTISDIRDSKGSVVDGTTVETSVTVTGTGSSGQQIQLMDGGTNIGNPFTVPETGTTWSTVLSGLTNKAYSIKAKPLYGTGVPDSAAKGFNVINAVRPTIRAVNESTTPAIPNGGVTAATSVILTGSATPGLSIDLFDNTTTLKGTFVATGGTWTTTPIAVAPGSHSFTAKAKYGSEPVSDAWTFTVITLTDQNKPYIQQAENNGTGANLDLGTFTGDATVKVSPWPGIKAGQRVWLRCLGKKANGADHIITLYTASAVVPAEEDDGLSKNIPRAQLEELGNNTLLTVELKIKFNGSTSDDAATFFPLRTYTVKVVALIPPTITSLRDNQDVSIPNNGSTVSTTVTLTGTATAGQKVKIIDGTTVLPTDYPVGINGDWSAQVNGLSFAQHQFKAQLQYATNPESSQWNLTVYQGSSGGENWEAQPNFTFISGQVKSFPSGLAMTLAYGESATNFGATQVRKLDFHPGRGVTLVGNAQMRLNLPGKARYFGGTVVGIHRSGNYAVFYDPTGQNIGTLQLPVTNDGYQTVEFRAPPGTVIDALDIVAVREPNWPVDVGWSIADVQWQPYI